MNDLEFNNNYDQTILAGASLGFCQDKYPHWGQTLLDHMEIGKDLHHFREVIFIDHLDCGAYKKIFPEIKKRTKKIKIRNICNLILRKRDSRMLDFKLI